MLWSNCYCLRCGLKDKKKRCSVFGWLKTRHNGITMLQETHSVFHDEIQWKQEWDGDIYFSHGNNLSRGVAILVPKNLKSLFKINNIKTDNLGRIITMDCKIDNYNLILINIYAPTNDQVVLQNNFLNNLRQIIEENGDKTLLIGGDFNTYLNHNLDKKGGKQEFMQAYTKNLNSLIEEFNLTDIWRARNNSELKFTRRENTKSGLVQSRLDFFLISTQLAYQVQNCHILPGFRSDHSLVKVKLDFQKPQTRGKSYWKFNNKLLLDETYVAIIKNEIKEILHHCEIQNKNTKWDFAKCQIRSITMTYCKSKAKRNKQKEDKLQKEIESLENNLTNEEAYDNYRRLKSKWEQIKNIKVEGAIIRSKAKWVEEGEKNTKYFLNLEKRNYEKKCIRKLILNTQQEITETHEILEEGKRFYSELYSTKHNTEDKFCKEYVSKINTPKLSDMDKKICESPLTIDEIAKALNELENDKSPGCDGFTTNFLKFFWTHLKLLIFDSFRYSFENNLLSDEQRRGILTLTPKPNKDLRYLNNWRPLTILNTDYKILTKALANRLQKVIYKIVNHDQVGYIKNRYIGENIRIIEDLKSYTNLKQCAGYMVLIDFQKAFDSIEWDFLFETLNAFNFGPNFVKWVKILYKYILLREQ